MIPVDEILICRHCGEYDQGQFRKRSRTCNRCLQDQKNASGAPKVRSSNLRRNYGITVEQYNWMLECQKGVCAVCGEPETRILRGKLAPLSVDHCHKTNRVRALLCQDCNTAFGHMKEDPGRIAQLLKYAKKWQDT